MASYDTINSWLPKDYIRTEQQTEALLAKLTNQTTSNNATTGLYFRAKLDNLIISINNNRISVSGSICKFYHGSNLYSLKRKDVKLAIEKLSDELHLPMHLATVTRLDIAQNIRLAQPVSLYMPYLGFAKNYERLEKGKNVYYERRDRKLGFYDKNKEAKKFKENIPSQFAGLNLLRYEVSYLRDTKKQFKTELPISLLSDERFYTETVKRWRNEYSAISKNREINLTAPGYNIITNHKELAYIALIEKLGGERNALEQIQQQAKSGQFDYMKILRAKSQFMKYGSLPGLTYQSDLVEELNLKIFEASHFE